LPPSPVDVAIGDVAAILAQMCRHPLAAGFGDQQGGTYRIGMGAAARVAQGGDVIDVDAETLVKLRIRQHAAVLKKLAPREATKGDFSQGQ
jgi:hypothetical protein